MNSRILITGGTGFIGAYLHTLNGKNKFRFVIRKKSNNSYNDTYLISEFNSVTEWNNVFDDIESIIHLAGLAHSNSFTARDYQTVNADGSLHLAREAAKAGVKRFVFISSIGVNGTSTTNTPFSTLSDLQPHNEYAQSKYDAEIGLKKIAKETGMELVIVRPTLVYGPNAPGNFGLLTKLVSKLPLLLFGLVNNQRSFIAVQNLSDLLIVCANHPKAAGHTFLASDGETVSIKEFTNAIADGLGKKVIQLPIPVSLMRLGSKLISKSAMAEQLLGNLEVDSSNAQEILGWTPPYSMKQAMASLSETLSEAKQ